jgi:tetratricopeptide (TPR) repeat protein
MTSSENSKPLERPEIQEDPMKHGRPSRRAGISLLAFAATFLWTARTADAVQRRRAKCDWPGSMWNTSAVLYLQRARQNPRPDEQRELYRQALDVVRQGMEKDPDNAQHYFRGAEAAMGLGDLALADSLLDRAEEMKPDCQEEIDQLRERAWAAAFNAGVGHLRAGNREQALALFERANLIYQKRPEALLQIGVLYARKSEDLRAQAATANPDEAARLQAEADSLVDIAIAAYRKALAVATQPEHQEVGTFNLAQLLAIDERYEEAADAYRAFIARQPENVVAHLNLGVTLLRLAEQLEKGETPEAKAKARAIREEATTLYAELAQRPDLTVEDLARVGAGLLTAERYDAAARIFRRLLEERPYDHDALMNLAKAFYLAEMPDSLVPVAERMAELYPNEGNGLAFLAYAYRETGATQKALEVLQKREALPFEVQDVKISLEADGKLLIIRGLIENKRLEPGSPVRLRFDFLDRDGRIVTTEQVSATAPPKEGTVSFQLSVEVHPSLAGFRYAPAG